MTAMKSRCSLSLASRAPAPLSLVPVLAALLLSGLAAGCSEAEAGLAPQGTVRIDLTDAPFPSDLVSEAHVLLCGVELETVGGLPVRVEPFEERSVNLLDLRGVQDLLVEAELPAGNYRAVRLLVAEPSLALKDGRTLASATTVARTDPVRVVASLARLFEVVPDLEGELLLDFDAAQSFALAYGADGAITGFRFAPKVRAVDRGEAGKIVGCVRGVSADARLASRVAMTQASPTEERRASAHALARATVSVTLADGSVATTLADDDGRFALILPPGSYDVRFEAPGYAAEVRHGIVVPACRFATTTATLTASE